MKQEEKIYTVYLIEYQGIVKYVGETNNFERRVYEHSNGRSSAIPVDVDMNDVTFVPIETYQTETDALKREDELIQAYDTINAGWNQRRSGLIRVSDVKEYQREYDKQRKHKPEREAYRREWLKEYEKTEKRKAYQREWQKQYYLRKKAEKEKAVIS